MHPGFRATCAGHLEEWTGHVVRMLIAAKTKHQPMVDFDPERVAWFLNSLWQGSILIGKTRQTPEMIRSNIELARAWVNSLFGRPASIPAI